MQLRTNFRDSFILTYFQTEFIFHKLLGSITHVFEYLKCCLHNVKKFSGPKIIETDRDRNEVRHNFLKKIKQYRYM